MLKRFFALLIALTIFLTLNSFADASTTLKTSQIVSSVAYDVYDGKLYAYTQKDTDGSMWVLDVKLNKGETLAQIKKRLIGHKVDIYYVMVDGKAEIIKTVIR